MRSVGILGAIIAAGAVAASSREDVILSEGDWTDRRPSRRVHPLRDPAPNDLGPVIDTTPESKRARRRRLAKEGSRP